MLRDKLTITELDILIALNKKKQDAKSLGQLLTVESKGVPTYIYRLAKRGLVNGYELTKQGQSVLQELKRELS